MKEFIYTYNENVPTCKYHDSGDVSDISPATWWGYNQPKIVRWKDDVFCLLVSEDNKSITLWKKPNMGAWIKGWSVSCTRPGPILIDSRGYIHVILPKVDERNRTRLMYYYTLDPDDIYRYNGSEKIVGTEKAYDQVNIRVGASIDKDDVLTVMWGLPKNGNPNNQSIYMKQKLRDGTWQETKLLGKDLGHDFYYPYVVSAPNEVVGAFIQDDDTEDSGINLYRKIRLAHVLNDRINTDVVIDADDEGLVLPRSLIVNDILIAENGTKYVSWKQYEDPSQPDLATHYIAPGNVDTLRFLHKLKIKWIRLFEIDGVLHAIATSYYKTYIVNIETQSYQKLSILPILGIYPYITSPRTGTDSDLYLDVLLLAGNRNAYPYPNNALIRIFK